MSEERSTLFGGGEGHGPQLTRHAGMDIAQALKAQGVEMLFTLCGGHVLPILDGCLDAGIRVIDARHEQAAVMMAEGYAYATRRPGVCAITAGPGFTNAVTGIANANMSGAPVVVLAGRTPLTGWNRGAIQDVDQLAIARHITKHAHTCLAPERAAEYVADAFWHARTGRPGVAYVEFPMDVLTSAPDRELSYTPGFPATLDPPQPASASIEAALKLLEGAERPVLIAGSGPFWGHADDALARFADTTGIPVTTTGPARGLLPDSHPGCLGSLVHGGLAVVSADVVVVCGSRFDGNMLFAGPPLFRPDQELVQIDIRAEAFGGNRAPELAIEADARQALDAIADAWRTPPKTAWLAQAQEMAQISRDSWNAQAESDAKGVHPGFLAREVDTAVHAASGGACTIVLDGGDILTWGIAYARAESPARILTTGTALGTLGVGLPFALGTKAARPKEPVVLLVGDGTFGLQAMEIETAARCGLPIVCVVANNHAWGDVRYEQREWFGPDRIVASELPGCRYTKLAEMVDGYAATVTEPAALRPALDEALASGAPAVIDVHTDPDVVSEILRGVGQLGIM